MIEQRERCDVGRIIVVPWHATDDLASVRRAVDAVGDDVACIVLDLGDPDRGGPSVDEVSAALPALRRAIEGQGRIARIVSKEQAVEVEDLRRHPTLAACLAEVASPRDRTFEAALTLPARLEYLGPVRKHVAGAVKALHGDADAFQVEILVDELCLNAVENSPSSRSWYDVRFQCAGRELQIDVTNPFDASVEPERIMHRRIESFDDSGGYLGERGRGLFLIARIADGLQIRSLDGDLIRVTVTKRLREGPGAETARGRSPGGDSSDAEAKSRRRGA